MSYKFFDGWGNDGIYYRHFIDDNYYEATHRIRIYRDNIIYTPNIYINLLKDYIISTETIDIILSYIYEITEYQLEKINSNSKYINYISNYLLMNKNFIGVMDDINFNQKQGISTLYINFMKNYAYLLVITRGHNYFDWKIERVVRGKTLHNILNKMITPHTTVKYSKFEEMRILVN